MHSDAKEILTQVTEFWNAFPLVGRIGIVGRVATFAASKYMAYMPAPKEKAAVIAMQSLWLFGLDILCYLLIIVGIIGYRNRMLSRK